MSPGRTKVWEEQLGQRKQENVDGFMQHVAKLMIGKGGVQVGVGR